jgi:hypothetical protein
VLVLIVAGSIASLNVVVMLVPVLAFITPLVGEVELTVGGVVSVTGGVVFAAVVVKTTSTQ